MDFQQPTLQVLLVRHARAEARSDAPDARRSLTRDGERRFREVVSGLGALGLELSGILTSPWDRARQTAELLQPLLRVDEARLQDLESAKVSPLLARAPIPDLLDEVRQSAAPSSATGACLALVGHEPWMGELLGWLVRGEPSWPHSLPKGGVVWLKGHVWPGSMEIRALLPPRVTRRLGGRSESS